jgi:amino acid transporter
VESSTQAGSQAGAASGSAAPGPSLDVFTRRSSGLVRELSLVDTAWYGVLAAGALFGLIYVFPGPQSFLPGLSVPLSALIAVVLMIPVYALYAGLGSAMPRIGGDYLYQSRAIHPAVGFTFTFAWEVFLWVTFTTTGALVISDLGLAPLLYNLGLVWHSTGLMKAGTWLATPDGILTVTLVIIALAFATTIAGIGVYRKIQRWVLIPTIIVSNLVLLILLLASHGSFINDFNSWHHKAIGVSNYYQKVQATATKGGFKNPGFSLRNTILFVSVTGLIWYVVFAAQGLLGEAKQANNFKKLFSAFVMGGAYVGIVSWILPTLLFQHMVSGNFMNAYAFVTANGTGLTPVGATIPGFAMMMTGSPIVLILLSLGFISVGYYFATCVFLNMTRVMTAMSMDRTLPSWFSKVSERWHAPTSAAIFYLVLAVALNMLFRWDKSVETPMVYGGAFTSVGVIAITGLAGVLFAYKAKAIHDVAPIAQYKFLGLPLIAVTGAITFLAAGAVTAMNLIYPELGFTTTAARLLLLLSLVVSALWFFGYRSYQRRVQGVDIDLAFRQVPPE